MKDNGVAISGELDIFGLSFNADAIAAAKLAGNSWSRRRVERQQVVRQQLVRQRWSGNS